MGSAPAPQPLQSDPSDPTATASAAGAAAPAVNHIAVELQWLSNPPKSWLHPDTGDAPGFADHMFNYEVELQLSQPSASASTQEPQPTPRDADDAAREAGASLLRHTFVYGKLHSIDAAAVQMLDTGVAVPTASSALQDDLTSADGSGTAPSKVAGSGLKAGSVPTASSAVQEALQPQQPAEVADDPPPVGVMWLWSKPQAEPEVEPAAKGAKKDPKQARRQSEAPRPAEKPEQDTLSANHVVRVALTEQMLYQLEQALEDGGSIGVSFRRVLSSRAAPEWEDVNELRYRATAAIPLAPFEEPGIDSWLYEACPLKPAAEEEDTAGGDKRGKKPAAKRGAKGAAAPPPYLIQEEDFGDVHPYLQLGTALRVKVSLDHPLVCLPERRPRPPRRPTDMIRRRLKHHKRPADAVVQYHHRVAAIVHSLVSDFLEMRGDMRDGEAACNDDIRRKFLQHIGSTGKYRREIRDALLRVVREHFGKKPGDSPEAMSAFYDELYVFMVEEMHRAIGRVFMRDRLAPQFRVQEENAGQARWLRLATEAEVVQEFAVAARYHQERLARGPDPGDENPNALADMWTEYGRFCLRSRDAVKAEEAFREAVSHSVGQPEPVHLPSLLALGLLLLSKDRFEEAEVCLQSAVDARMHDRLPWGSLALCHERAALVAGTEAENKQRLKRAKYARLFAARAAAGKVPATSDDCATGVEPEDASDGLDLALAKYTLGLWLEDITDHCLSNLPGSDTAEVLLLRGRMNFQLRELDQVGGARDWLANRLIKQEPKHYEGLLLLGDVYASLGESPSLSRRSTTTGRCASTRRALRGLSTCAWGTFTTASGGTRTPGTPSFWAPRHGLAG
eukprot:TRINITY_DN11119_c0_g1_i1.p1 TRINITY_DN11119_c0_g1~~TRINITY_DN11119_c0_g1_i1.p1  ORF type:complete len:896 (+),score=265.33 TRINITY_DN11119_c0_g1_i1:147-2690(+)